MRKGVRLAAQHQGRERCQPHGWLATSVHPCEPEVLCRDHPIQPAQLADVVGVGAPLQDERVDQPAVEPDPNPDPGLDVVGLLLGDQVVELAVQVRNRQHGQHPGDRLVLGAQSGDDLAAVRLTTVGALDASFAGGGVRGVPMPDEPSDQEFAQDLAVAEDGRIAVAGLYDTFDEPGELLVALMDADGQDPAAGCDAGNRVSVSAQKGADARGFGVAFDGDRVVLVGGASERGYQRDETAIAVLAPGVLFRNGFD